jgi:hypothetical protein
MRELVEGARGRLAHELNEIGKPPADMEVRGIVRLGVWKVAVRHACRTAAAFVVDVLDLARVAIREPSHNKAGLLALCQHLASLNVLPLFTVG